MTHRTADDESGIQRQIGTIRLEGVTMSIPEPLGSVDVRFHPGVDVLYGLNGAGKTRVLQSLLVAVGVEAGERGGAVHARITSTVTNGKKLPWWHQALLESAEALALRYRGPSSAPWMAPDVERLTSALGTLLYAHLAGGGPSGGDVPPELALTLSWAVVRQGRMVLQAFGPNTWVVWLAARSSDAEGDARRALAALERHITHERRPGPREERDFAEAEEPWLQPVLNCAYDFTGVFVRSRLVEHPWAGLPLFCLDQVEVSPPNDLADYRLIPVYCEFIGDDDVDRATSSELRLALEEPIRSLSLRRKIGDSTAEQELDGSDPEDQVAEIFSSRETVSEHGGSFLADIERSANQFLSTLLTDAPRLDLHVRAAEEWYSGKSPLWWSTLDPSGERVPISDLSRAQKRWAMLAIQIALAQVPAPVDDLFAHRYRLRHPITAPDAQPLLVLDEPENALHPSAQRFLARGLALLDRLMQIVVASHSASFLNQASFRLHHVSRGVGGLTYVHELRPDLRRDLCHAVGLSPSDLFEQVRLFIVVEGRHDEVILSRLLKEDFDSIAATVVPMSGASQLSPVLDSRFLFDYTDSAAQIVLDNLQRPALAAWAEAKERYAAGDIEEARKILLERLDRKGEVGFLRNFGIRAIELGRLDRVDTYGLSAIDILDYLPVEGLIPAASGRSWAELRREAGEKNQGSSAFKKWLRKTYSFSDDDEILISATDTLTETPAEFVALVEHARRLARSPWVY